MISIIELLACAIRVMNEGASGDIQGLILEHLSLRYWK